MNEIIVEINGTEYYCRSIFDADLGDGVDVLYNKSDRFVGESWGISVPDENDEEAVDAFIEYITNDLSL